jgi:hypothetical protein
MILHRVVPTIRFIAVSDDTSEAWAAGMLGGILGIPCGLVAGLIAVAIR